MNFQEMNFALLENNHPALARELAGLTPAELTCIPARSGEITAKLGEVYLHSRFDPRKEATALVEKMGEENITGALFFGFGLGYLVEEFIHLFPGIPVVIFEPDLPLLTRVLKCRSLVKILTHPSLRFKTGSDLTDLPLLLESLPKESLKIIRLRSVFLKDEAFYKDLEKGIHSYLAKKEINFNTLNRFGKLWVKNLMRNIRRLALMPGIVHLTDRFKGFPALILASGPSVEEIFPLLPELQKRFLLVVVDTSLRMCLEQGVNPDFTVVVDPQYWNTRHLDWAKPASGYLISESSTHPRIFRSLTMKGFFASSFFPLGQFLESVAGYKGKIGAGGSVATSAWDFARLAGCDPLIMGGLDLGFPGKQTHFKGAFFEGFFHTVSSRTSPVESHTFRYIRSGAPHYAEANNGGKVLTDKRMTVYKSWFESQKLLYPDTTTYNLSTGGLKIETMTPLKAEELLSYPLIRPAIEKIKQEMEPLFLNSEEPGEAMKKALEEMLEDLNRLSELARRGLGEVADIRHLMKQNLDFRKPLANLDKIDASILGQTSRIIAGFLLQPVIHRIMNAGASGKSGEEIIDSSEEIYRELYESSVYHYDLMKEGLRFL